MMRLVIVGCGGFGREVHDVVDAINDNGGRIDLVGFVDDAPTVANVELVERRGSRVLGTMAWFDKAERGVQYVIGIGSPAVCERIDTHLSTLGFEAAVLVHPAATTGWEVTMSPGTIICAGARLSTNIYLGRHVHVDRNCLIGHDSILQDWSILYPGAAVAGSVRLGRRTLIGSNATCLQSLEIGQDAVLGAGALLTRALPAKAVGVGVPARWRDQPSPLEKQ